MHSPFASNAAPPSREALNGRTIVITRPAGTGTALSHKVSQHGGVPVLLPGLSLRAASDPELVRAQWQQAQRDEVLIFTSPAAVRYAVALASFDTKAAVLAVGKGTARALRRHRIDAQMPATRQDSEGVLQLPLLQHVQGRRIALVTAPGGRGLLQQQLTARGAHVREVYVYRRCAPRLDRRHWDAVLRLPESACVLLSSGEAMQHLLEQLPPPARHRLCASTVVVSSERLAEQARAGGFARVCVAASAHSDDLLAAACAACSSTQHEAGRAGC